MTVLISDADRALGARIVAAARAYVGAPWRHQGRTRDGIDCVGMLIAVARDIGVDEPDVEGYRRNPDGPQLTAVLKARLHEIPRDQRMPGAILELRDRAAAFPIHVGVVSDIGVIHACAKARRVIEHRIDREFERRIVRCYLWRPSLG